MGVTAENELPVRITKGADAVAIAVTEEEVAPDAVPDTPFGLGNLCLVFLRGESV